ncbi:DUF3137 domain-containing protein [Pedobacter psychroterrae]|uniref:DUF3137 domain-containing protein n=1 Tax=Pedobacter psychroterrae TaxID=2530453 RepID=A0A4R0NTM1_9SPHI|nr:DUF3137 domain-containing protein [Pedobacter psychroterrae]TCD03283.1 DUF3137 domain-containing protein [Pedobacter psychroterrae]
MAEDIQSNTALQATLAELEDQRKIISRLKTKSYLLILVGIVCAAAGVYFGVPIVATAIAGGLGLIAGFYFLNKAGQLFNEYRHAFKQRVISAALKSIDQSMDIDYQSGMSENDFVYSQLFTNRPDRYSSQDQIYGAAGKTKFSFSEVHAEYKTVTQTKNGKQEHWHTILKGIVFCADFNKHFNGTTVVRPKDMGSALGAWISEKMPLFSSGSDVVKLESPVFDKKFITYSTDQVEARYILTPSMMERLCNLDDSSHYSISVSFIGSYVYIAFPLDKDYFEPPVFKSLLDQKSLMEDLEIIRFMYGIIAELDLNTRIWTKQ